MFGRTKARKQTIPPAIGAITLARGSDSVRAFCNPPPPEGGEMLDVAGLFVWSDEFGSAAQGLFGLGPSAEGAIVQHALDLPEGGIRIALAEDRFVLEPPEDKPWQPLAVRLFVGRALAHRMPGGSRIRAVPAGVPSTPYRFELFIGADGGLCFGQPVEPEVAA